MPNPGGTTNAIDVHRFSVDRIYAHALEALADFQCNANGSRIVRADEADDMIELVDAPGPLEGCTRRLSSKPIPPSRAIQYPTEIDSRPFVRMKKTHAADHSSRRFLHNGPLAVAPLLPVAQHSIDVPDTSIDTAERCSEGNLPLFQDLGILMNAHKRFRIRFLRLTE